MHPPRGMSDDDGDLGLQGMSIEGGASASPSPQVAGRSTFEGAKPTFGIMKLLGSVVGSSSSSSSSAAPAANASTEHAADAEGESASDALSAGSYHSTRDSYPSRRDGLAGSIDDEAVQSASERPTATSRVSGASETYSAIDLASTDDSPSPDTPTKTKDKRKSDSRKAKRLTKLREEIAGPVSHRPLAGSSGGPPITQRKTSIVMGPDTASSEGQSHDSGKAKKSASAKSAGLASAGDTSHEAQADPAAVDAGTGQTAVLATSGSQLLPSPAIAGDAPGSSEAAAPSPGGMQSSTSNEHSFLNGHSTSSSSADHLSRDQKPTGNAPLPYTPPLASPPAESGLDEAALQRWVLSVGCVNFDLERGPDLEFLYPSLGISREERDCIAFSSFPDTSIFDDGHAVFSWRVREVPLDSSSSEAPVIGSPKGAASSPSKGTVSRHPLRTRKSGLSSPLRRLAGFDRFRTMHGTEGGNGDAPHINTIEITPSFDESGMLAGSHESPVAGGSRASSPSSTSHGLEHGGEAGLSHTSAEPGSTPDGYLPLSASTGKANARSSSTDYIHGFCYFRQRRDATIRRGYFQKSIVILSHLPYVSFFGEIVRRLGPLFFEQGMPILEAFAQDVQSWPPPEPGARLHLPLLGSVITVELPLYSQAQTSPLTELKASALMSSTMSKEVSRDATARRGDGSKESEPILASIPVTPMFEVFKEALDDMWLLWECLILAEPILVVGPDPTTCSEAVWHMLDLIKPIPFAGDFRPYFTIHDHDFKALVTKNRPSSGVIIGVTNPFMLQACKHWPHILKVGKAAVKPAVYSKATGKKIAGTGPQAGGVAGGNSAGGGGPMHTPGLESKGKRRISKDRALLKSLSEMAEKKTSDHSANDALRLYFTDLTERFLAPLNRYVSSLIPADFSLASPSEAPKIRPFNTSAFLASLKSHGTPLPVRSRNLPTGSAVRQSLYLDFIQCPNFSTWLHARIRQSREEQYMRKLAALESGDIPQYVKSRGELETIDLYSRLRAEVHGINHKLLSGRQERELQANSRWRPVLGQDETASSPMDERKSLLSVVGPGNTSTTNCPPLESLVRLPANADSAKAIRNVVNAPSWQRSFTSSERVLLNKKARLIDQLDRLLEALPADLRQSLLLKERQRRMELMHKQSKPQLA